MKAPGQPQHGWATPRKPPGQRGGAKPSVALRFAPFEAARPGRDRGEVPRTVCADSQSVALGMAQDPLISSVADASARCKPLTSSQSGDRAGLAVAGAGLDARATWGTPEALAGRRGSMACQPRARVTFVAVADVVGNMWEYGETISFSAVRVTFGLGPERDSQRDNARLVNITRGKGAIA